MLRPLVNAGKLFSVRTMVSVSAVPFPCSPEVILNVTISIIVIRHTVK